MKQSGIMAPPACSGEKLIVLGGQNQQGKYSPPLPPPGKTCLLYTLLTRTRDTNGPTRYTVCTTATHKSFAAPKGGGK